MANHNVTLTHTRLLPPSAQIFGLLPSLFYSFLRNARLFSLGDELPHTIALSSLPASHFSLSPLLTPRLGVLLSPSLFFSLSLSPSTSQLLFCSALVLLVLKRSACMITNRPDLRRQLGGVGRERQMKK